MGLAFLPWERLPAYVFGPLLCLLGIFGLFNATGWHVLLSICNLFFGIWLVWRRYTTGVEPLWTEEQRSTSTSRKANDE